MRAQQESRKMVKGARVVLEQIIFPGVGCREEAWWKVREAVGSTLEAAEGSRLSKQVH